MADQMTGQMERARPTGRNWGLLLILLLCVEFWVVVSSLVAHSI